MVALVMLFLGWGVCSGAFTFEAHAARERLAALLDARHPGGSASIATSIEPHRP